MSESKRSGIYMYAIVPADRAPALAANPMTGLAGAQVFPVVEGEIAAVVSRTEAERLRPERRNLAAHQNVLKALTSGETVLPMSFGIVSSSEDAVRAILRRHGETFKAQLKKLTGKVEMGLRVTWDVPNIFEYFISRFPELRTARDTMLETGGGSRDQMIALGQLFESRLNDERESVVRRVTDVLKQFGVEVKRNPARSEREVVNLACLVGRERQNDFDSVVCEAARGFDNSFLFDFNGPWSPHNFVDVRLAQPE